MRVLIVDDDGDTVESLELLLQDRGYDTRTAFDGEEALLIAEAWRPEVVVLDVAMPRMSGYKVCKALRQMSWAESTIIIIVSGLARSDDHAAALKAGCDHHVRKPITIEELEKLIRRGRRTRAASERGHAPHPSERP